MKKVITGLYLMAFLACSSHAEMTLGSIADVHYLTLEKGDIGDYKASFFNMGDRKLYLEFSLEYPNDLKVEISPKKLTLYPGVEDTENCNGCEFFILSDGKTYVRTYPVHVYVKIPPEISRNIYEVKLVAKAKSSGDDDVEGIRQSMVQVREIIFTAYVPGTLKTGGLLDGKTSIIEEYDDTAGNKTGGGTRSNSATGIKDVSEPLSRASPTSTGESAQPGNIQDNTGTGGMQTTSGASPVAAAEGASDTGYSQTVQQEGEKTRINLPTGDVVLSKQASDTVIDIGIVTLAISVITLLAKVLKS